MQLPVARLATHVLAEVFLVFLRAPVEQMGFSKVMPAQGGAQAGFRALERRANHASDTASRESGNAPVEQMGGLTDCEAETAPANACSLSKRLLAARSPLNQERSKEMEVFEAVRTVLAVRQYQAKPAPPEVVRRIVEAGRLTGSSMNAQPWHFIVVENQDTLRQLGALASTGPYIAQAPLAVVVVIDKTRFAVSDASRAIQAMILTAWSEGVGSNWVGFLGLAEVKPLLSIPEALDVLAIVPFGYPAQAVGQGKKARKSLSEVAHRERFGQPFV